MMIRLPYFGITVLFLLCSHAAQACYNTYTIQKGELFGNQVFMHIAGIPFEGSLDQDHDAIFEAQARYKASNNLQDYSDYGVALCYAGEYQTAMRIFMQIEKKKPNLYQTAANIGTTYELLGKLDAALFWIKKGVQINPNSHDGSEWIHIKILEHEIAAKGNPDYSLTHSILGLDFGNDTTPKKLSQKDLFKHLEHQLNERVAFVKPQNTVVGQLICAYGNLYGEWQTFKNPINFNEMLSIYYRAQEYGYTDPIMEKRMAFLAKATSTPLKNKLPKQPPPKVTPTLAAVLYDNVGYIVGILAAIIGIIGIVVWRLRKKMT
jgi:tetratricopeptide (TPR) repeat protein